MHNETLSVVAMRVSNPDRSPLESIAATQPQLQSALLRLSAMPQLADQIDNVRLKVVLTDPFIAF
jgi:hypothetical protein